MRNSHENHQISGKLCINFEVNTEKCKRDYIAYLYNIARRVLAILVRLCNDRITN